MGITMALDMLPDLSADYCINRCLNHTILLCQLGLCDPCYCKPPYLKDSRAGQLGIPISLPTRRGFGADLECASSFSRHILSIARRSREKEMRPPNAGWIVAHMANIPVTNDGLNLNLIPHPMSPVILGTLSDRPISAIGGGCRPNPTWSNLWPYYRSILINVAPESDRVVKRDTTAMTRNKIVWTTFLISDWDILTTTAGTGNHWLHQSGPQVWGKSNSSGGSQRWAHDSEQNTKQQGSGCPQSSQRGVTYTQGCEMSTGAWQTSQGWMSGRRRVVRYLGIEAHSFDVIPRPLDTVRGSHYFTTGAQ